MEVFLSVSFPLGVAGLYDFGPPGCALQANIVDLWRRHFVFEEEMLEVDTTILTPYEVLKSSGHVDRFSDWMTRDSVTGDVYRADHLLKAWIKKHVIEAADATPEAIADATMDLAKLDGFSPDELQSKFASYGVLSDLGNSLTPLSPFNLMFGTEIGPSGLLKGFMRPETAQGQFVNFKRLLEANSDRMPFASAQIGKSFRNEISPRSGLLRVREFLMAEIEHYVNPEAKNFHPKFESVSFHSLPLLSREMQSSGSEQVCMTRVDHAIEKGIIDNSTLGYFLVRIYLFLLKIGLHPDIIRFRQHQSNEMAHYASDCWDAELLTSYGWIECVGCADRAAFDLTVHSLKTKEKLVVRERLSTPVTELRVVAELDRKAIGITFKKDAKLICDAIALAQEDPVLMEKILQESLDRNKVAVPLAGWNAERSSASCPSDFVEVPSQMLGLRKELTTTHVREYTPAVIEPSFGIGRIIYALLEHCYWVRAQDEQRSVLSLAPLVAPTKVLIAPLLSQKSFEDLVSNIALLLKSKGIATQADCSSATVGKKYARADELGTPFAVTIDHQTVTEVQENIPATVTVRERDSTTQIRVFINDLPDLIENLVQGKLHWNNQLLSKYEVVQCSNC
ncbi:Glycine--tRNA ligase 1 [Mitosporidium daphniae]